MGRGTINTEISQLLKDVEAGECDGDDEDDVDDDDDEEDDATAADADPDALHSDDTDLDV